MRKVYLVLIKEENGNISIKGAFTNETKAWKLRDKLLNDGFSVASETIETNENVDVTLSMWISLK